MNLREQILREHSKANCDKILAWIGKDQDRFNELFHLFLNDEYRVIQRAAWPLSYSVIAYPFLIKKHFGKLLKNLSKPNLHNSVKRNTVRLLQEIEIPKKYQGRVMNICFDYITSPGEAVAIKAFSLTILEKLSRKYPEIIPEIKLVIEQQYEHETIAFKTRAKRFLQRLG